MTHAGSSDRSRPANRLAGETSPYLLQHAHNPVEWWPWGAEAIAEARRRDVPIFLSIGYSTCYWCHVMERESFENEEIGRLMSELFVCVKLDREERPDLDELYMAATQLMTGSGGWPMSVFVEPEGLRPFWCGTYFPPEGRWGRPGFPQVLRGMAEAWRTQRAQVLEQAGALAAAVGEHLQRSTAPVSLTLEQPTRAAQQILSMHDRQHGGFGGAPKFPQPVLLELLLDVRAHAGDEATRAAIDAVVRFTLDRMAIGGLQDQIGGGFHRYCVDAHWTVPHFEKMLYDNAQLVGLYARAAATYGDGYYRRVVERTIAYVAREMTGPDGSFYSAQDAEVDGLEGANYMWRPEEARDALPEDLRPIAMRALGLDGGANFQDPHHPDAAATHVLRLRARPEEVAAELGMTPGDFDAAMDRAAELMRRVRDARPKPRLDDKVLASWNGLMIAGLARAARLVVDHGSSAAWLAMARRAAGAVLAGLRDPVDGLRRTARLGRSQIPAFLEDYACLADALLELHAAGVERVDVAGRSEETLGAARALIEEAWGLFGDEASGAWHDTRAGQADLFVRPRSAHDGAMPSGAAVMARALSQLHAATGDGWALDRAIGLLGSVSADITRSPVGAAGSTRALLALVVSSAQAAGRLAGLGPAPEPEPKASEFTPVEIYADRERVEVGPDRPASLRLVVRIKPGYHINAADPGGAMGRGLVPLRVGVVHGRGVAAFADYPAGEAGGVDGEIRVHRGDVEFEVALEREGEWSGRPLLSVTYQACTETACLPPTTVELDVAIDRVG